MAAAAPIVEVAGDDQRRRPRDRVVHDLAQQPQLLLAVRFAQAEVHADRVQRIRAVVDVQLAMQQSAFLVPGDRDVAIPVRADRVLRQQRVAVVAVRIHRVAPVGGVRPDRIGEELVLRRVGPLRVAALVQRVFAEHFLQEHQVRADAAHGLAQLVQHEAAPEQVEAHVAIEGEDSDGRHGGWAQEMPRLCGSRP